MRAIPLMLACCLLAGCATGGWRSRHVDSAATIDVPAERQIVITVRNAPTRTALNAGSTAKGYDAATRYQISPAALRDVAGLAQHYGLRELAAWPIEVLGVHCIVFEVPASVPLDTVMAQLAADPRVESAQPLRNFQTHSLHPHGGAHYDDPYVGLQENLTSMQVEQAHQWSRGRGVRVAVIDSGVDDAHPDLARRITLSRDLTGLRNTARKEKHGTAVAGVIAADAGNGEGIVGIAPEATVLALRACWQLADAERRDAGSRCNSFTLAQAITLAIAERADIINMSLSGPADPLLERLLRKALAMGKIVVGAVPETMAGGTAEAGFPANLPGVLAVASQEAGSADGTPGTLYAPGRKVLTLRPEARYDFEDGSSMAAANVTGVVALLLAAQPRLTAAEIRELLQAGPALERVRTSPGRSVNACFALAALVRSDAAGGDCEPVKRMHAARQ